VPGASVSHPSTSNFVTRAPAGKNTSATRVQGAAMQNRASSAGVVAYPLATELFGVKRMAPTVWLTSEVVPNVRGSVDWASARATIDITASRITLAEHLDQTGWLTVAKVAAQLGVHLATARRFASAGVFHAVRANDRGLLLFEPPTGPLPRAHPGKSYRDRRRYPQCASHARKELQYEA
jgi:hypothetical protein